MNSKTSSKGRNSYENAWLNPIGKDRFPGRVQQISSCFCATDCFFPWILLFPHVISHLFLSVPFNFAVLLRLLFHFKRKCTEGPTLDFSIDLQRIQRKVSLFVVGKSLVCNPSPATIGCYCKDAYFFFLTVFLLLYFVLNLELWARAGVCWATHRI